MEGMVANMEVELLAQSHCTLHQEVTESQLQDHPTHEEKKDLSDEMGSRCSHHHWSELTPLHSQAVCVGATVFDGSVQLMHKVMLSCCACMKKLATANIELVAGGVA